MVHSVSALITGYILFTDQFYFKIQVKTLLADISLKYMKILLSEHW